MSRSTVFPYGIVLREGGAVDMFPAVKLLFPYKNGGEVTFLLLIDSGAHMSALPMTDADIIGVRAEDGDLMSVAGINGVPIRGWRHDIPVRCENNFIHLPVVFLDDTLAPRVLGRAGVFEKFTIVFDETKKRSGFLPTDTIEAKSVNKILNNL
ncbi:hypothetical protein A2926_01540 [Candidatus Giovannonibacteria bacterium RIFCSPLOWO2_01_FULL_44_40]|uniref:Peptidase A2 domain-containing protein n=1 Tax=Candidatus Giovannonibacteria bacterium RIFCSPHIGHO2_01_FULL_45_23 TaxID=1798325 RepID=A0A1F5VF30_9BACT|nr:MAG: hypothetical protein A2834_01730 [Candidatus Giovannonibacteria bacterium RIFCSPHIGHO2_01_FULL_45_23]OGF75130.1 MAG: hypothetical protein A3C77_01140 [Candidatus Giovannonibacteria bacterium RIFCSPHIGHO2_02_FULL_45_13]OGF79677.1 MAG: hypothetical protein A2926_01540 [Candidatus Giovannonibacteria bacterium RIFCSPLOWO2_01_FULL_44_40]